MAHKQEASVSSFTRQTITLILHIMRNLRGSGADMHPEIELSYPQILMLYVLLENGTSSMSEVASLLKISHGVATRTADRLVDKRLVDRRHADTDRRMVLLSLSKQGKEYAEEMLGNHMEKLNGVFEEVNLQEREGFLTLLENIDARLEE